MEPNHQSRQVGISTACGPRTDNQDCALAMPEVGVYAVADGMGGLADGFASAKTAVEHIRSRAADLVEKLHRARTDTTMAVTDIIEEAVWQANDAVRAASIARHAPGRPPRSGCTLTVAAVVDGTLYVGHVGDSRAYLIDSDGVMQLTEDHSVAAARVRRGRMTEEEALHSPLRNKLYQAVGISEELDVDILEVDIQPGDRVMLCSDGLWERVTKQQINESVRGRLPSHACEALMRAAEARGLVDNTTVVVVDPRRVTSAIDKVAALQATLIFSDFAEVELQRLVPYFLLRRVEPGDRVICEQELGRSLFVLGEGRFSVTRHGLQLDVMEAPGHVGEMALIRGGARTATVTATTTGWVLCLNREPVEDLVRRRPELGAQLAFRLARSLADRLEHLNERVTGA